MCVFVCVCVCVCVCVHACVRACKLLELPVYVPQDPYNKRTVCYAKETKQVTHTHTHTHTHMPQAPDSAIKLLVAFSSALHTVIARARALKIASIDAEVCRPKEPNKRAPLHGKETY